MNQNELKMDELEKAKDKFRERINTEEVNKTLAILVLQKFIIPNTPAGVKDDKEIQETISKNGGKPVSEMENFIKESFSFLENDEDFKDFNSKVFSSINNLALIDTALSMITMGKYDESKDVKVISQEAFDYLKELLPYDISLHLAVANTELELIEKFFTSKEDMTEKYWTLAFERHDKNPNNLKEFFETGIMTDELINDLIDLYNQDNTEKDLYFITFVFKNQAFATLTDNFMFPKYTPETFELSPSSIEEKFNYFNTTIDFHEKNADIVKKDIYNKYKSFINIYLENKELLPKELVDSSLMEEIVNTKDDSIDDLIKVIIHKMSPIDFSLTLIRDETEDKFGEDLTVFFESLNTNTNYEVGPTKVKEVIINMQYSKAFNNIVNDFNKEEIKARGDVLAMAGGLIPLFYNIRYNLLGVGEEEVYEPYDKLRRGVADHSYIPFIWSMLQGFYDDFLKEMDTTVKSFDNIKDNVHKIKAK